MIGREVEKEQAVDVHAKRRANNALPVVPPGVGKTAVARGIARHVALGSGVDTRVFLEIPVTQLLAGTGTRGSLAERLCIRRAGSFGDSSAAGIVEGSEFGGASSTVAKWN